VLWVGALSLPQAGGVYVTDSSSIASKAPGGRRCRSIPVAHLAWSSSQERCRCIHHPSLIRVDPQKITRFTRETALTFSPPTRRRHAREAPEPAIVEEGPDQIPNAN
jgi:hypothetical protein